MSTYQTVIIIAVVTLGTVTTRFLPFLIFSDSDSEDSYLGYLGKLLPYAAMGLLVVYCLKGVSFERSSSWMPEAIAIASIVLLDKWKENTLLSIGGGTLVYMALVQTIFA